MPENNAISPDLESFESLPLDSQLSHLETRLSHGESTETLIRLCAALRDPAPLAWLSSELALHGWLDEEHNRHWFAGFLLERPETSVLKILKQMLEAGLNDSQRLSLAYFLIGALEQISIEKLPIMCIIDRLLKHNFAALRSDYISSRINELETIINQNHIDSINLDLLAQIPASALVNLEKTLQVDQLNSFRAKRKQLAEKAISVLESAPKAVSQTNAEDLLARRVYTDPGHFLIELLQNADDTGARRWHVIIDRDRLIIWHDGLPFDVRDLVGITSIGQTTKRKQQIGFFGVGFKSVYEITDRPQVYSDVYQFEIADVSIPKLLRSRPEFLPENGTALVLPLRKGMDKSRSPVSLYEKAIKLDACVLLTLRSIDEIRFELTELAGGPRYHALIECATDFGASIKIEPSNEIFTYLIQDDEFKYSEENREAGRPDTTKIMTGVLLDEETGIPVPLDIEAAQVYSYLPTREKPGLKFFLQGHFDVPVDRERIAPDSPWNQWIMSKVPLQLARLATSNRTGQMNDSAHFEALLKVLPLKRELASGPFARITRDLGFYFEDVSILPGHDSKIHKPSNVLVASHAILDLFGAGAPSSRKAFLSDRVEGREREVAIEIGARTFTTEHLLVYLESILLQEDPSKELVSNIPDFLFNPAKLRSLYDIFLEELEQQRNIELSEKLLARLEKLPIVLDAEGNLKTRSQVHRGSREMRSIYDGIAVFVHPELDDLEDSRTSRFLNMLDVKVIRLSDLAEDLKKSLGSKAPPMANLAMTSFPGTEERLSLILSAFCRADWELQREVSNLPIFKSSDGMYWPASSSPEKLDGALLAGRNTDELAIAEFYGPARPIVVSDQAASDTVRLLRRINAPELGLSVLICDLEQDLFELDKKPEKLNELHDLLEAIFDEVPENVKAKLVRLPVWPDMNNRLGTLEGAERIFISRDEEICELFSGAQFLRKDIANKKHVRATGIKRIDEVEVIEGLCEEAQEPLSIEKAPSAVRRALSYILERAPALPPASTSILREKAIFLGDREELLPLQALSLPDSQRLRMVYGRTEKRKFIEIDGLSHKIVKATGIESSLQRADASTLIEDLESEFTDKDNSLESLGFSQERLLEYLVRVHEKVPQSINRRFASIPIWPDQCGLPGLLPINEKIDPEEDSLVFPCEKSLERVMSMLGVRILDRTTADMISPILHSIKAYHADIRILVSKISITSIDSDEILDAVQSTLSRRKNDLRIFFPIEDYKNSAPNRTLNSLAIWRTLGGEVKPAAEVLGGDLSGLFEKGSEPYSALENSCLPSATFKRLADLAPYMQPLSPLMFISETIEKLAKPEKPLVEQPSFLSSIEHVALIHKTVANIPGDKNRIELPLVDAENKLTFRKLFTASEDTIALLEGLPVLSTVLAYNLKEALSLEQKAQGRFGAQLARFLKSATGNNLSYELRYDFEPLPIIDIIKALDSSMSKERREFFYRWLLQNQHVVFEDHQSIALLKNSSLFITSRGSMVTPLQLLLEDDFPELGSREEIDWFPGEEIPKELIKLLSRKLDIGKHRIEDLIKAHILPAYLNAVSSNNKNLAGSLLAWMATRLSDHPENEIKRLLKTSSRSFLLERADGEFARPEELIIPSIELKAHLSELMGLENFAPSNRYPVSMSRFLFSCGVRAKPSISELSQLLSQKLDPSKSRILSLAAIVNSLFEIEGEMIFRAVPALRNGAWLLDGKGQLKAPFELYRRKEEILAVVGNFPEKFIDQDLQLQLGSLLCNELGFKEEEDISCTEVVEHIKLKINRHEPTSFEAYRWLERAAAAEEIRIEDLEDGFGNRDWILTDDGIYFHHEKVLGSRFFEIFGDLRGYWLHGWRQCPNLCKLLGIKAEIDVDIVKEFVHELGEQAKKDTKTLLEQKPALPQMLINAFAILAENEEMVDPDLPIIPCEREGQTSLVEASSPSLYWSDTPTLEKLFADTGVLYLAKKPSGANKDSVFNFFELMGIRRLRDTYKILVDSQSGVDRSQKMMIELIQVRQTLKALLAVIPRIEKERALDETTAWVYKDRLAPLATSGSIRAIENLQVRYVLEGVGEATMERSAAFDVENGELLIDLTVLGTRELTGLSEGLLASIIEGPQAETFIDLFEILIARREKDSMNDYLNRRHFAGGSFESSTADRLIERIEELLDYGLASRLSLLFPDLLGEISTRWKEPELANEIRESISDIESNNAASRVAQILLAKLSVIPPNNELQELLARMLEAESISKASEILVAFQTKSFDSKVSPSALEENAGTFKAPEKAADNPNSESVKPERDQSSNGILSALTSDLRRMILQKKNSREIENKNNKSKSFWDKFRSTIGSKQCAPRESNHASNTAGEWTTYDPAADILPVPKWATGNYFAPSKVIPPQIWYTQENRRILEASEKHAKLYISPKTLPTPYRYSIHRIGVSFDSITQCWRYSNKTKDLFRDYKSNGRFVSVYGHLFAGENHLPLPLYSKLAEDIEVRGGELVKLSQETYGLIASLKGDGLISVRYKVELMELPELEIASAIPSTRIEKNLLKPTTSIDDLPEPLRIWLEETRQSSLSKWEQALAVQDFVKVNYKYDENFMALPEVIQRRKQLRLFRGNHHLELLHSSGNDKFLGHGVCYELNVLIVEMLRQLGIPACVATGWVLHEGLIHLPDHMFALAIISTKNGQHLMPLDGAATLQGPIRTLSQGSFTNATAPRQLDRQPTVPNPRGAWDITPIRFHTKHVPDRKYTAASRTSEKSDKSSTGSSFQSGSNQPYHPYQPYQASTTRNKKKNSKQKEFLSKLGFKSRSPKENELLLEQAAARASNAENLMQSIKLELDKLQEKKRKIEVALERERQNKKKTLTELAEERRRRKRAEGSLKVIEQRFQESSLALDESQKSLKNLQEKLAETIEKSARKRALGQFSPSDKDKIESSIIREAYRRVTAAMCLDRPEPLSDRETKQQLREILGSAAVVDAYIEILHAGGLEAEELQDEFKTLTSLGLVCLENSQLIRILPAEPEITDTRE